MIPGPSRSASVTVSPGIGRLLSSLEFGSGLFEDERFATKSFNWEKRSGSTGPTTDSCAAAERPRSNPNANTREIFHRETSLSAPSEIRPGIDAGILAGQGVLAHDCTHVSGLQLILRKIPLEYH